MLKFDNKLLDNSKERHLQWYVYYIHFNVLENLKN